MRGVSLAILLCWLISAAAQAVDRPLQFRDGAEEARFRGLANELRCLVCQNQSIEASHAPLAQDLRDEVLRLMRAGHNDEQIKDHLRQRYGEFVLYRPALNLGTVALWFGPLAILVTALLYLSRKWRRRFRRESPLPAADRERLLETLGEPGGNFPRGQP